MENSLNGNFFIEHEPDCGGNEYTASRSRRICACIAKYVESINIERVALRDRVEELTLELARLRRRREKAADKPPADA
jgi:hypothetical protein